MNLFDESLISYTYCFKNIAKTKLHYKLQAIHWTFRKTPLNAHTPLVSVFEIRCAHNNIHAEEPLACILHHWSFCNHYFLGKKNQSLKLRPQKKSVSLVQNASYIFLLLYMIHVFAPARFFKKETNQRLLCDLSLYNVARSTPRFFFCVYLTTLSFLWCLVEI